MRAPEELRRFSSQGNYFLNCANRERWKVKYWAINIGRFIASLVFAVNISLMLVCCVLCVLHNQISYFYRFSVCWWIRERSKKLKHPLTTLRWSGKETRSSELSKKRLMRLIDINSPKILQLLLRRAHRQAKRSLLLCFIMFEDQRELSGED